MHGRSIVGQTVKSFQAVQRQARYVRYPINCSIFCQECALHVLHGTKTAHLCVLAFYTHFHTNRTNAQLDKCTKALYSKSHDARRQQRHIRFHSHRSGMALASFVFFPDSARHLFSAAVQYGRCRHRRAISRQSSPCRRKRRKRRLRQSPRRFFSRRIERGNDNNLSILRRTARTGTQTSRTHRYGDVDMGGHLYVRRRFFRIRSRNESDFNAERYLFAFGNLPANLFCRRPSDVRL